MNTNVKSKSSACIELRNITGDIFTFCVPTKDDMDRKKMFIRDKDGNHKELRDINDFLKYAKDHKIVDGDVTKDRFS